MTVQEPNLTAEQARETYRANRVKRFLEKRKIPFAIAPLATIEIDNALPNNEGLEKNLLSLSDLSTPLPITIPTGWSGDEQTELYIYLDNDVGQPVFEQMYPTKPSFPLKATIEPVRFNTAKEYSLNYLVRNGAGDEYSDYTYFTVDRDDPNRNNIPHSLQAGTDTLTKDYLQQNNGLPFTIPAFDYPRPGDYVVILMTAPGEAVPSEVARTPARPVQGFDPALPLEGVIPKDIFLDSNGDGLFDDGTIVLSYVAYSRAGNGAKKPIDSIIQQAFLPLPENLQNAIVPLAVETPALIDRADAILGVTVQIPEYDNYQANDRVSVRWGTRLIGTLTVGPQPEFPLETNPIAYATLLAEGASSGTGPKDVNVTYVLTRGQLPFNPPAPITIGVDLRIPGPENPDKGPVNPALGAVTVFGGGTNPEANKIRPADIGHPVSVQLPAYAPLTAGEILQVYWNEKKVDGATHTVVGGETDFDIAVPYDFIRQEGDGPAVLVHIGLSNPSLPPGNEPTTEPTPVAVDTFQMGPLQTPAFPDKNPTFESIGCRENVWEGAKVQVAGDLNNFAAGDTVRVRWEGRVDNNGTPELIPGSDGFEDYILTETQVRDGLIHVVAFDPYLDLIGGVNADLYAWFELIKQSGASGSSDEAPVKIRYVLPGGCQCKFEGACPV